MGKPQLFAHDEDGKLQAIDLNKPAHPGLKSALSGMTALPKARVEFYELDHEEMPAGIYLDCTVIGKKEGSGGMHVSIECKKSVEFMDQPLMEFVHADKVSGEAQRIFRDHVERMFTYFTALTYGLDPLTAAELTFLWHGTGRQDSFPGLDHLVEEE